jgi:putative transposase
MPSAACCADPPRVCRRPQLLRGRGHDEQTTNKFSPEVRDRAVRMAFDHEGDHPSRWAAVVSIAEKIGCTPQTLHEWVKKAEVDAGKRAGVSTEVAEKLKALERENRELRQANDPTQGICLFCPGGARPPIQAMIAFIDDHREAYGVEPICRVLPIAPSTYHERLAQRRDPARLSARG